MSDHSHYGEYADARHTHEGDYAAERHDHDLDYAEKYHRHQDLEREGRSTAQFVTALRDELANMRRELDSALGQIRDLERLRPTCVICLDATATQQTVRGPACSDCVGDPAQVTAEGLPYGDTQSPAAELAAVLRQLADRYVQVSLTGAASDTHRAIAEELAGAFHTLAGALGSKRGHQ